jgi:hypothetical protein
MAALRYSHRRANRTARFGHRLIAKHGLRSSLRRLSPAKACGGRTRPALRAGVAARRMRTLADLGVSAARADDAHPHRARHAEPARDAPIPSPPLADPRSTDNFFSAKEHFMTVICIGTSPLDAFMAGTGVLPADAEPRSGR